MSMLSQKLYRNITELPEGETQYLLETPVLGQYTRLEAVLLNFSSSVGRDITITLDGNPEDDPDAGDYKHIVNSVTNNTASNYNYIPAGGLAIPKGWKVSVAIPGISSETDCNVSGTIIYTVGE